MKLLDFNQVLDSIFEYWYISLFILLAVLLLLTILFKGLKKSIKAFVAVACVVGALIVAGFIVDACRWSTLRLVEFGVQWGPTILFTVIILISTLIRFHCNT